MNYRHRRKGGQQGGIRLTDHAKRRQAVHSVGDTQDIADAIDRCNLKPEYKRLLKILYVDNGCLEDVCEAVGREYTTVSKWHKAALVKLVYILHKSGKL